MIELDAMSSPANEMVVKTSCGGYLSIGAIMFVSALCVTEWQYFTAIGLKDEIMIGKDQDTMKVQMLLNVTFHRMPCEGLSINVQDSHGSNVPVTHKIWKRRLDETGALISKPIRSSPRHVSLEPLEVGKVLNATDEERQKERRQVQPTAHKRCSSCYQGTEFITDRCCNSCESVSEAIKIYGPIPSNMTPSEDYVVDQCAETGIYSKFPPTPSEGCRITSEMSLTKRKSSEVAIGINSNFRARLVHPSWFADLRARKVNMSHTIHHINFGPHFPGFVPVLDGRVKNHGPISDEARKADQFEYEVNLIPTVYEPLYGAKIHSHQYSVIEHSHRVTLLENVEEEEGVSVGFFLLIKITAFEIRWRETQKTLIQFIVALCAIVGGIFAFTGLIDNFFYRVSATFVERQ